MKIEERTYEMPDGATKKYYIKLNQPAVCILALTPDSKVIVVEQFRPGPAKTLLELPGGYVDKGETTAQAAVRELHEETSLESLRVEDLEALGVVEVISDHQLEAVTIHATVFRLSIHNDREVVAKEGTLVKMTKDEILASSDRLTPATRACFETLIK